MTVSASLPVMRGSQLDTGHRTEGDTVFDALTGVAVGRLEDRKQVAQRVIREEIDEWTPGLRAVSTQPADDQLPAIAERYPVLDWHAAFAASPEACDWLVEPLFERGRIYAVYAPAKAGKSLLLQDIAAGLATGRPVLGNPAQDPVRVLYVDLENSVADIVERLSAYGYVAAELGELRYLSFPTLPALNSKVGGKHLEAIATHHAAELVVIDTVSRVVDGAENDADTFHGLYRHALAPLKARGLTVVRLDHGGKDDARGQRGSSAKSTDVDTVWRMEETSPTGRVLIREATRTTHHPERVTLVKRFEPLRHEIVDSHDASPSGAGIIEAVADLARLGVPVEAGRDRCRKALTDAGIKISNGTLAAAIKARQQTCPQDQDRRSE